MWVSNEMSLVPKDVFKSWMLMILSDPKGLNKDRKKILGSAPNAALAKCALVSALN